MYEKEFINRISSRLIRFRWSKPDLANFRCPYCGDSKKSKTKCRGYFYIHKKFRKFHFHCQNCGYNCSLKTFLKEFDEELYKEFCLKSFGENRIGRNGISTIEVKNTIDSVISIDLPSIESLPNNHYAKQYILNRKIPNKYLG